MKHTFTKTLNILLLMITCLLAGFNVHAQYTVSILEPGKQINGLAKDNAGNIFAIRSTATSNFELVKYPNGDPSAAVPIYSSLTSSSPDYPWGVAVNDNGDVFVTDIDNFGWKILKFDAGTYTRTVKRTGGFYCALAFDNQNRLLAMEFNNHGDADKTNDTYRLVRFAAGQEDQAPEPLYDGIAYPTVTLQGNYPWGITVDNLDNIYIFDRVDNAGGKLMKLSPPNYNSPTTIATGKNFSAVTVDGQNNVYTLESIGALSPDGSYHVVKYTAPITGLQTGVEVPTSPTTTLSKVGVVYPWGLVVDNSGNIFAGDHAAARLIKLIPPLSITSVTRAAASPTNAPNVTFTVKFNRAPTTVPVSAFTLATTGVTGTSISNVTGSGDTYTVTVGTGAGSGTIRLDVNGSGISPTLSGAPYTMGEVYTIDRTPPDTHIDQGPTSGTNNHGGHFEFSVTPAEAGVSYEARLDGTGAFIAVGNSYDLPATLTEGTHTLEVRAKDALGNVDQTPASYTWVTDYTPPHVDHVVPPADGTYKDGGILTFQVVFSEPVAVTGTAITLDVNIGGTIRKASFIGIIGGSNNTAVFRYQLQQPDTDDDGITLGAITLNGGSIADVGPNHLTPLTLQGVPFLGGVRVDTRHPIPTITTTAPSKVNGAFPITITFDEDMTGALTAAGFTSLNATVNTVTPVDARTWTALITPPPGEQNGSGSVRVLANAVTDAAGNGNLASNNYSYTWDTKAPAITGNTPPADGYYKAGDVLSYTITYDENITVTGAPTLPVSIGGNTWNAALTSSTANTVTFSYTIVADEEDLDGIDVGPAIALNGGTIMDAVGNNAALAVSANNSGVLVDARPPTVISVDMPPPGTNNGYYNAGDGLTFTVHTSEPVFVTRTPSLDVVFTSGTRQTIYVSGHGSNTLTFVYTVTDGDNDENGIALGTQLQYPGGSAVKDAAGNDIAVTLNNVGDGSGVLVNTVHPTVAISSSAVAPMTAPFAITINFSEEVTDDLLDADIALTGGTISGLTTSDHITWQALITPTTPAQGTGTIQVKADAVHNTATNGNDVSNTFSFDYDTKAPAVFSISRPPDGYYKAGQQLSYIITYDENITVTGSGLTLPILVGADTRIATLSSSTANSLTFSYTITEGEEDLDGISMGTAIALNGGTIKDAAGNNAALAVSSNTPGVLVDAVSPDVSSVSVPANGHYKAGITLTFTVNTSEDVMVTGTPSIDVVIGTNTRKALFTGVTGSSTLNFEYTIVPDENDADGIAIGSSINLEGGAIQDAAQNDMDLTLNNVPPTSGIFVNTNTPSVTISTTAPALLNTSFAVTAVFSEAVTGFTTAGIAVTNAGLSGLSTSDNITYTFNVLPTADGPVTVQIPAGAAVNNANTANTVSNELSVFYDKTRPFVQNVTLPAGNYKLGDMVIFTVKSSEILNVGGEPFLSFDIGSTPVQAKLYGSDGSETPTFRYEVKAGDFDDDGIVLGPVIDMNGGYMRDVAKNLLIPDISGSFTGVVIDGIIPTVTSIDVPASGYHHLGDVLKFTVHTSENITVTGVPDLAVIIGGATRSATYTGGTGTKALTFEYTVQAGDIDMDGIALGALNLNSGTLRDLAGNDMDLALNAVAPTNNVFVNTIVPSVTLSTPATLVNGQFTVTIAFSEKVTGLAESDFMATNCTLSGLTTSDNITYQVTASPTADPVTLQLPAGAALNDGQNGNSASNLLTVNYDGTAPVITGVALPPAGTYKAGDALTFTVTYDENVTVNGTPSLIVVMASGNQSAAYTGGGANTLTFSYTVQANDLDADGLSLDPDVQLDGSTTIRDAAGNNAVTALNGISANIVKVDAVVPVVSTVDVPADGYYTTSQTLDFTVHFNENVVVTGSPVLNIVIGAATKQATLLSATGPDLHFRYTVQSGDLDMDGIAVGGAIALNAGTIKDDIGNDASLTLNSVDITDNVFVLANRPAVTINGVVSVQQPWTASIVFSHAVTGFTLADISLTNAVASDLQTSDNITYTALISPVNEGGVSIEIPANIAADMAGNLNTFSSRLSYYYDPNPPVITSVEVPGNGHYKEGDVLNFAVNWNEVVEGSVLPTSLALPVIIGNNTVQATYTGGFNTQRITFAYTVQAGDMDLDGIQPGTELQFTNPNDRLADLSGNPANRTLNNVANTSGVFVHTGRPSITLTSAAAARVNAPFTVTATFNEKVTLLTAADFTPANATVSDLQTTDNITYTLLVTPTAEGAITISLPADVAENVVGNGNTASNSLTRTYDITPPIIAAGQSFTVSQYTTAGTIVGTVTASDGSGTVENWAIATDGSGGALQISAAGVISVKNTTLLNALAGTNVSLGLTVTDGLNTSAAVPVTVRVIFVNQPPTLDVINNVTICADEQAHTIQLTGASATEPGQTYTITARSDRDIFDELSIDAADMLTYRLKADAPAGTATVTVTIRDNGGTTGGAVDQFSRTFMITVNSLPTISITSDKGNTISKGDVAHLTATGANTYAWANADGILGGQQTGVLEVRPMTNATYEVTATTAAGCSNTASIDIAVLEDFKIDATNILTPNGDGHNDRWVIRNIDSYPDNELKIFDRTGRLLYTRRNYSNDWDGTLNGKPLAEGTYYYILTISNGAKTAKGYITIVRDRY